MFDIEFFVMAIQNGVYTQMTSPESYGQSFALYTILNCNENRDKGELVFHINGDGLEREVKISTDNIRKIVMDFESKKAEMFVSYGRRTTGYYPIKFYP